MNVELHNIEQFRAALKAYEPSEEAAQLLKKIDLVILLGVSGGGRNTIINRLVATERYHFIVSDTTRPPKVRDGKLEQDGVQYHFRSEDQVLRDLSDGQFLEAEVIHNQQVSGTSVRELKLAYESGKIPINEVDIAGTVNILKAKPDTKMFFIVPPTYEEWMRRLAARETMSQQELANRSETAVRVLQTGLAGSHFRFIVNDSPDEAAALIDRQVSRPDQSVDDTLAREAARQILHKIENQR